jgi:hypothetical protein
MNNLSNLSPTAQALVKARIAADAAMTAAWKAEGTEREADMDAAFDAANAVLETAKQAHRVAVEASRPVR